MKPDPQYHEPRSAVVFRHTTDAIRNSGHTDSSLAQAIAEQYMADVAPGERILQFHTGDDADSAERALKAKATRTGRVSARIIDDMLAGIILIDTAAPPSASATV